MQIDPNTQAPSLDSTPSEDLHAPAPVAADHRNKKGRKPAKSRRGKVADLADVTEGQGETERFANDSSAVIEGTDLDAVVRRLRSGAYNTREVAEVIARRLLASGDL